MLLKRPSAILGTSMLERLGSSSLSVAAQIWEGKMVLGGQDLQENPNRRIRQEIVSSAVSQGGTTNQYINLWKQKKI